VVFVCLTTHHTLTGMLAPTFDSGSPDGAVVYLKNVSLYDLTFAHQSLSSSADNRFVTPLGYDLVVPPNHWVHMTHDKSPSPFCAYSGPYWVVNPIPKNPLRIIGDIVYATTRGVPERLPIGQEKHVLTVTSGLPTWRPADPTTVGEGADFHWWRRTGTAPPEVWYTSTYISVGGQTVAFGTNLLYTIPFVCPKTILLDRIAIRVMVAGSAGSIVKLGIYKSLNVYPGELLLEAGEVSVDTTGVKVLILSNLQLTGSSLYFFVLGTDSTAAGGALFAGVVPLSMTVMAGLVTKVHGWKHTWSYGLLPTPFPNAGVDPNPSPIQSPPEDCPAIFVRLSA